MEQIILKEREIKEKMVGLINNSGMPAFMLKNIIKELYDQLNIIEQQQYEEALKNKQEKKSKASK